MGKCESWKGSMLGQLLLKKAFDRRSSELLLRGTEVIFQMFFFFFSRLAEDRGKNGGVSRKERRIEGPVCFSRGT